MMQTRLVIERVYEPPAPDEMATLLRRVYGRLFDPEMLERLTRRPAEGKIIGSCDEKGAGDESSEVRQG